MKSQLLRLIRPSDREASLALLEALGRQKSLPFWAKTSIIIDTTVRPLHGGRARKYKITIEEVA